MTYKKLVSFLNQLKKHRSAVEKWEPVYATDGIVVFSQDELNNIKSELDGLMATCQSEIQKVWPKSLEPSSS